MIIVAAAVITRPDGAVLLARRAPGRSHAGLWEFPGGKLEPGETPEVCLMRELREELGVAIEVGPFIAAGRTESVTLLGYRASLGTSEFTLNDHDALAWVTPAELDAYRMPPADLPIAAALKAASQQP